MRRQLTRLGLAAVVALGVGSDAARALAGFGAPFLVGVGVHDEPPQGARPVDSRAADARSVEAHRADPRGRHEAREAPQGGDSTDTAANVPRSAREVGPTDPVRRYAQLERAACEAELEKRGVPFTRVAEARGVLEPLRLTGPVHGVTFHSAVPPSQRASSPWEIIDCRLALALDDFAAQLASHDIVEVVHYSIYRPPPEDWPADKAGGQHVGALAIDAASFTKKDGTRLDVERDFHGRIGALTCGPSAAAPTVSCPEAVELRQIVCDAAEARLFNVALTPDYNRAHYNHFHLEVGAGIKWLFLR